MWRQLLLFPGAILVASSALGVAGAAQTGDPIAEQRFEEVEDAAELALEFDPWTIGEQELLDALGPIETNQLTQQAGVGTAMAVRDTAEDDHDDAIAVRESAHQTVEEQGDLLETFAINSFLQSDPELDPDPDAQAAATRRQAPFETVTSDVIADFQQALKDLEQAKEDEADAGQTLLSADSTLQLREEALVKADELLETYHTTVEERQAEIDLRIDEALNLNDAPELTQVRGFKVNLALADSLEALLVAAEADGIILGGWGHRPVDQQIVLRIGHCGDSGYAIFDMPAGNCSPPTARPGHSEHELGLAVDFTENGVILNRSSPGFLWLKENAGDYGLINLPSEAWHWSTTGH